MRYKYFDIMIYKYASIVSSIVIYGMRSTCHTITQVCLYDDAYTVRYKYAGIII